MSRSFLSSVFTVAGGTAVAQAIALAVLPVITRLYPPQTYGAFVVFLAWGGFLVPIACARFEVAIALPRSHRAASAVLAGSLAIAAAVAAVCALVVGLAWAAHLPMGEGGLAWLPLYVFLGAAVQALGNWAARAQAFRRLSLSRMAQAGVTAVLSVALVWTWGAVPQALILATLAGQAVALAWLWPGSPLGPGSRSRSRTGSLGSQGSSGLWRVRLSHVLRLLRHYRRLTVFNVPHVLSDAAQGSGLPLLIAHGFGAPAAAYYAFSTRLLKAPLGLISGAVSQVYYPRAAAHRSDDERLRHDALRILAVSSAAVLLAWPVLLLVPDAAYAWAFGAAWADVGAYLRALSPWILSSFVAAPLSVLYLVKERFGLDFLLGLAGTVLAFSLLGVAFGLSLSVLATMWLLSAGMTVYIIASTVFEFTYVLGRGRRAA